MFKYVIYYFFFFQAEDGIRDVAVTGVQTCALPIYVDQRARRHARSHAIDFALERPLDDVDPLLVRMAVRPPAGSSRHAHETDLNAFALDHRPVGRGVAGAGVDRVELGEIEGVSSTAGLDRALRLGHRRLLRKVFGTLDVHLEICQYLAPWRPRRKARPHGTCGCSRSTRSTASATAARAWPSSSREITVACSGSPTNRRPRM